ncbi:hypothetical protein [Paenibacillus koleovorans]|uniref:hypothetical protein n=1 Tax=Paenibacillus koleovorans TaxID=121608 RepID=UPI000FD6FC23|nr:hypothetical protein [Paenibacillus koleovorans]
MGVVTTAFVSISLTAYVLPGIDPLPDTIIPLPLAINLLVEVPYPVVGGLVTIDLLPLLGIDQDLVLAVPGSSVQTVVLVPGVLEAQLAVIISETA